jgi:hypothetical protein
VDLITRIESGGVVGPPLQSAKCVTPDQARNVAKTFSPVAGTVNSECAPLERNFADGKLAWKLVCKGQLDMEVSGAFHFDSPRHYTAIVHTTATMAGAQVANSQNHLEAQWVSECQ